jgi:outer membrane lipoprotein-sorting protein
MKASTRVFRVVFGAGLGLLAWAALPVAAQTADDILREVRLRDDGKDVVADVQLILADQNGKQRVRDLIYLQKDYPDDDKLTLYFTAPADVRGVGFQSVNYDEAIVREDDQWLYLPAFRQIRRISASDKRGAFMGSEFAYIDMEKLRVSDYRQSLAGSDNCDGRDCYVVERTPVSEAIVNKTGYYRTVLWVDKETHIVMRQDYYDIKDVLFKTMRVRKLEKIGGIWTVMQADMNDPISGKASSLVFSNVRYNVGLEDTLFQQSILKTGVRNEQLSALR